MQGINDVIKRTFISLAGILIFHKTVNMNINFRSYLFSHVYKIVMKVLYSNIA